MTSVSIVLAAGFVFDNEGVVTLGSLNVNGSVNISNAPGADFTISSSFAPSSGTVIDNGGTFRVEGNLNFNTGTILQNNGTVDITSGVTVDGVVENRGVVSAAGMNVNGGSNFFNGCELSLGGDFNNNATAFTNSGLVETTGAMTNNNNYTQTPTGLTSGVNFTNNGSVTGFGALPLPGPHGHAELLRRHVGERSHRLRRPHPDRWADFRCPIRAGAQCRGRHRVAAAGTDEPGLLRRRNRAERGRRRHEGRARDRGAGWDRRLHPYRHELRAGPRRGRGAHGPAPARAGIARCGRRHRRERTGRLEHRDRGRRLDADVQPER